MIHHLAKTNLTTPYVQCKMMLCGIKKMCRTFETNTLSWFTGCVCHTDYTSLTGAVESVLTLAGGSFLLALMDRLLKAAI